MSTAKKLARHAKFRGGQRYGQDLSLSDLRNFVSQIRSKNAIFVRQQGIDRSQWMVWKAGTWFRVVFDKKLQSIVTVLPPKEDRSLLVKGNHDAYSNSKTDSQTKAES